MKRRRFRFFVGWAAATALLAGPAMAQVDPLQPKGTVQSQAFGRWKIQDQCIADARRKHPDRTLASQQARDVEVDRCLDEHHLPPRAHAAPDADAAPPAP